MLVPSSKVLLRAYPRLLHVSARRCDLIAPPDPISHMRPIIYEDSPTTSDPSPPSLVRHPYSLSEFSSVPRRDASDLELQYRLQRSQLDAFHHSFWFDSNSRFEAGKEAILSALPSTATGIDKENALSEFYKQWVIQERDITGTYTSQWRRRNMALVILDARIHYQRFTSRFSTLFSSRGTRRNGIKNYE